MAVELSLREKSTGELQYLVDAAQFLHFTLQRLDTLTLVRGHAIASPHINLVSFDPFIQGMRRTANLGGNGLDRSLRRGVLASVFKHHAHRTFTGLGGIFGGLGLLFHHGSILLGKGASSKSGAVQFG